MESKKGFVGIGILLIFIALVIVAAVAAGVLVRTSNSLQSRALATGEIAKQQVSTGVEVMSIDAIVNSTTQLIYGYEVGLRILASSDALNPDKLTIGYVSPNGRFITTRQGSYRSDVVNITLTDVAENNTFTGTSINETVDLTGDGNPEAIAFNLSSQQVYVFQSETFYDGSSWDISSLNGAIVINTTLLANQVTPILDTSQDQVIGYLTNFVEDPGGSGIDITVANEDDSCTLAGLKRGVQFCVEERLGDGDVFMDESELWIMRFRVKHPTNGLSDGQEVEFRIITTSGIVSSQKVLIPSIVSLGVARIYP